MGKKNYKGQRRRDWGRGVVKAAGDGLRWSWGGVETSTPLRWLLLLLLMTTDGLFQTEAVDNDLDEHGAMGGWSMKRGGGSGSMLMACLRSAWFGHREHGTMWTPVINSTC